MPQPVSAPVTPPPPPKPPVQIAISGGHGTGRDHALRDAQDIADIMRALQQPQTAPQPATTKTTAPAAAPLPKIAIPAPPSGAPADQHIRDAEDIADIMRVLAEAGYGKKT